MLCEASVFAWRKLKSGIAAIPGRPQRVEISYTKLDGAFLIAFNVLARLFGVLAIFAGIVFLVSAYAIKENRFLDIVIGLFVIAMGIALTTLGRREKPRLVRL
jgi:uncharacterized membrane protein HdeD (DUF308 family)